MDAPTPDTGPRGQAYAQIKGALLQGGFAAGQMLSLRELAARFACPMAAVRDAVVRLECERLLRVHPQRGIQVVEVDLAFVLEACQLRLLIELEGLRLWLDEPDRAAAQALHQRTLNAAQALEHDTQPATVDAAMRADWAMHAMFVDALRSTLMADIYRQNRERQRLIGRVHRMHPAKVARSALLEHLDVLAAMAEADRTRAAQALAAHLNAAMRRQIGL